MKTAISTGLLAALFIAPSFVSAQTTYRRPYQGDYGVTAYWDADGVRGNGSDQDYQCSSWSYDGHGGTDYGIPLGTNIVAVADGTVTRTNNGCPDYGSLGNTCGGSLGNWVELRHADGSMTMYAHMKLNSLQVSPGQDVTCGQVLGRSASSGSSTGPHLHLGSRSGSGSSWSITATRDPYKGACGRTTSLWVSQGAFKGAPGTGCQVTTPAVYDIDVWTEATGIEDRLDQGTSFEQPDALPGDVFELSIYVHNKSGVPIRDVQLGYLLGPHVEALDYVIESNFSGDGGEFGVNDSDSAEGNPPKDAMGAEGALTMYAFADGETKRVRITVTALEPVISGEPAVRGWLRNVTDVHVQGGFDEEPSLTKTDEPPKASSRVDVLEQAAWTFDSDEPEMLEGWSACEGAQAIVDPMRAGAVVSGDVRCLTSPSWTAIDAETVNQLNLEIAPESASHAAALFWSDTADGAFDPERSFVFEVPADAERVEVPLYDVPTWSGTVARLQLHTTWDETPADETVVRAVAFSYVEPPVVDPDTDPTDPTNPGSTNGNPVVDEEGDPNGEPASLDDNAVIEARGGCSTPGGSPRGGGASLVALFALAFGLVRIRWCGRTRVE